MRISQLSRRDLLEFLNSSDLRGFGSQFLSNEEPLLLPEPENLWAIWGDESKYSNSLPGLLVVRDEDLKEFLAWTSTFFVSYRPFTGHFRVVSCSLFNKLRIKRDFDFRSLSGAFIGAVFGELLTEAKSRKALDSITIQGLGSTCSFAMARALAIYGPSKLQNEILEGWSKVRRISLQKERTIHPDRLKAVWSVLAEFGEHYKDGSSAIARACIEIQTREHIYPETWKELTKGRIPYSVLNDLVNAPKEDGILFLEQAIVSIAKGKHDSDTDFILGYLTSLLGNGLGYSDVLFPVIEFAETALLWYGICVGLRAPDVLMSKTGGIARRTLRDIQAPFLLTEPPDADLSAEELLIILDTEINPVLARTHGGSLKVELLPGIATTINWPSKSIEQTAKNKSKTTVQLTLPVVPTAESSVMDALDLLRAHFDSRLDEIQQKLQTKPVEKVSKKKPRGKNRR